MKSYKIIKLLLCLLLAQASVALADDVRQFSPKYDYVMTVNRSTMAVVDSNVVVSMQITAIQDVPALQSVVLSPEIVDTVNMRKAELPLIFLNSKNQHVYFERDLKNDYPEALALRKKNGKNLDFEYLRTVKYESWMDDAVLKLRLLSCSCNRQKDRGEIVLGGFPKEEKVYKPELYPVYLLPPADKSVKVREEKGSAYLCFVVNKWDIKPDYMSNPTELQKIHNSVNIVKNDSNVTIQKMTIDGYASPEGGFAHNTMLSENRTNSLKAYLQSTGIAKGINIQASGRGENWDGFIKYLRNHGDVPQREKLLSIATSSNTPDDKEKRMRKETPQGYAYVLKNVFPELRCTNYNVIYTVRPFTVEESEKVFETRPINLNLNEIYKLADKYSNNQEKYNSIIRKAYLLYPNDSYINLTMAYLSIKKGEAGEAAEYLSKVKNCPEKTMNEGLVAYLKGDLDKAIQLVNQAKSQGVPEATPQLEEFGKIKK